MADNMLCHPAQNSKATGVFTNLSLCRKLPSRVSVYSGEFWRRNQVQPLPNLRKICFPRNCTQVTFYRSRIFPKFSPIQLFFFYLARRKNYKSCVPERNCHKKAKTASSKYWCRPSQILHLFRIGYKTLLHVFFLKFAPAGKNLRKVEFM